MFKETGLKYPHLVDFIEVKSWVKPTTCQVSFLKEEMN